MPYFGESDVDTMLADSPYSITIAGVTKRCEFSERDEVVQEQDGQAGQIIRVALATVRTADFLAVKGGDACVLNELDPLTGQILSSTNNTVWRRLRIGDGALTELYLRKV